jgi:hypothetical protein
MLSFSFIFNFNAFFERFADKILKIRKKVLKIDITELCPRKKLFHKLFIIFIIKDKDDIIILRQNIQI